MTVRVIIEREIEPGQEARLQHLMIQARSKAIKAKGYISGETLRALDNPNKFLVLSNWNSAEDWKAWEKDPGAGQTPDGNWRPCSWARKNAPYTCIFNYRRDHSMDLWTL